MTIVDAITSSPFNVFLTIVIGLGLAYLYCRKPSSSTGSQSSSSNHHHRHISSSTFLHAHPAASRLGSANDAGLGIVDEEFQRSLALIERQERDMIRQEQDAAYQQSLMADREKRLKSEKERLDREAKEKAERDEKEQLERLHQRLTQLKNEIKDKLPNIAKSDASDIVKLVFKLPDGTRVKQDFCKQDKVKYLYWFVFSLKNAPLQFRMTTNFPKRDLPGRPPMPEDFLMDNQKQDDARITTTNNTELTLAEVGLTETQIIFVYDLEA